MKPRVILVHGFNVRDDGANTVGQLAGYFAREGFEVKRLRYGWRGLLGVRFFNTTFARLLADLAEPGDIIVAHSNGGAIAYQSATEFEAPFSQLVLINPALDSDVPFPKQLAAVHVWHSPSDSPVTVAKWLPFHSWGDMGAVGYRGPYDPRVKSYNKENGFEVSSSEHSDVFRPGKIEFFGPLIVAAVNANLKETA